MGVVRVRRVMTIAPGADGVNTDDQAHLVGKNQGVSARDAVRYRGLLRQMKGWPYDGTQADVADNLHSVSRARFTLAGVTRTITIDDDGELRIHNPSSAGTLQSKDLTASVVDFLDRAGYHDERFLCCTDGVQPLWRYSGASVTTQIKPAGGSGMDYSGAVIVGAGNFTATPPVASYIKPYPLTANLIMPFYFRILEASAGQVTLEDVRASGGTGSLSSSNTTIDSVGRTFPCVPVYEAGTVTYDDSLNKITGTGTKWSSVAVAGQDAVMVMIPNGKTYVFNILSVTDDTHMQVSGGPGANITTACTFKILRPCNFTDVTAHRGSFFGTGNFAHPNCVYAFPQGWNPSLPPKFVPPFDPAVVLQSDDPNDFTGFEIEVPAKDDGDPNVALLSSPSGLLVVKRWSASVVNGDYPSFSQQPLGRGCGCIDHRSAVALPTGRFWGGEAGIFREQNGTIEDITLYRRHPGGVNRDWRSLMDGFAKGTDYVTIGEADGKVLVGGTSDGGATAFCWEYDLSVQAFVSTNIQNCKPRYFFSSKVPGEPEKLLWVGDAQQGRVMDSAPALNGTGLLKNGDGTTPALQWVSGSALGEAAGIEGEALVGDVNIHANVVDASSSSPTLTPSLFHANGARQAAAGETKALTAISADAVNRVERYESRANRSGRLLQLTLTADASGGTNDATTAVEIDEIVLELFDTAGGT